MNMDRELLTKYIQARKTIQKKAARINRITHLISLLKNCHDDVISVDPHAMAKMADQINSDTCAILEALDDFIFITDAENRLKNS